MSPRSQGRISAPTGSEAGIYFEGNLAALRSPGHGYSSAKTPVGFNPKGSSVMAIEELTDRECRAIAARTHLARLACALNNQPYIVPVHIDFHDSYLYGFSTLGQKIEWMRQNPLVCLEIDELSTDHQWTTVIISGRYEELPDSSGMSTNGVSLSTSFRGIRYGGSPPRFRLPVITPGR